MSDYLKIVRPENGSDEFVILYQTATGTIDDFKNGCDVIVVTRETEEDPGVDKLELR